MLDKAPENGLDNILWKFCQFQFVFRFEDDAIFVAGKFLELVPPEVELGFRLSEPLHFQTRQFLIFDENSVLYHML